MEYNSRLENGNAKFLCRCCVRVDLLPVDRCRSEMVMSQVGIPTIIDLLQFALIPGLQQSGIRLDRFGRSCFLQYLTVNVGEISRGPVFDEENEDSGGHGDGARSGGI